MNEIQIFKNEQFGEIRTVLIENEPWFVEADVCEHFGVTNRNRVMQNVDEQDKGGTQINTPGGAQTMTVVNESGLYSLLFALQPTKARGATDDYINERMAQLKGFKRWVTKEVLPSIRKHGAYMTPETIEQVLLNPDTIITLATQLKELQTKVKQDAPKVLFASAVETSHTSILVGDLAKLARQNGVDIGQNRLFQWMRDNGFLIKSGRSRNMPTQYSMELGLFEVKERTVSNPDGSVRITKTPVVTGKGQVYFINKLLSENSFESMA